MVSSSKCLDEIHCKAQHAKCLCSQALEPGAPHCHTVHQGQSHLSSCCQGPWATPSSCSSSPLPKMRCSYAKNLAEIFTQSTKTIEAATRGWQKKDQVFLSEQQLSSGTWSPAAIFNKMLLFNIVYYQQPMVIFSWTMHRQASKSLSLSLKLGRIFQELHNDITSLPLPTAQLSQQQHPLKYAPKSLGTQSPRILCTRGFFNRKKWFAQTNPWYAY